MISPKITRSPPLESSIVSSYFTLRRKLACSGLLQPPPLATQRSVRHDLVLCHLHKVFLSLHFGTTQQPVLFHGWLVGSSHSSCYGKEAETAALSSVAAPMLSKCMHDACACDQDKHLASGYSSSVTKCLKSDRSQIFQWRPKFLPQARPFQSTHNKIRDHTLCQNDLSDRRSTSHYKEWSMITGRMRRMRILLLLQLKAPKVTPEQHLNLY